MAVLYGKLCVLCDELFNTDNQLKAVCDPCTTTKQRPLKLFKLTIYPCPRSDGTEADGCIMHVLGESRESVMEDVPKQQGYSVQPHAKTVVEVEGPFRHGYVISHEVLKGK